MVRVPKLISAQEGESLEVACQTDANPPAFAVYWSFSAADHGGVSTSPPEPRRWTNGPTLAISQVNRGHAGMFRCHAQSTAELPRATSGGLFESSTPEVWWQRHSESSAALQLRVNCELPCLSVYF